MNDLQQATMRKTTSQKM